MTRPERATLDEVLKEHDAVARAVAVATAARPRDEGLAVAARRLEATYLLRLYAAFEELVRTRHLRRFGQEPSGIAAAVQAFVGEERTLDSARPGAQTEWWRILSRDRNLLAHGRATPPALNLWNARETMEAFLWRVGT